METFDDLVPQFRRAKDRWPDAPTLQNHYKAMVESYAGSSHGLIGTAKSFLECVCLTILGEFGKAMPSSEPTTTELLVETLKVLGLQNTRGASKVDKLLSAHNRLAETLNDMRNENDPVAHGKDGFLDAIRSNERRAFLVTADTILALLMSAFEGREPDLQYTREHYDQFANLHERMDRSVTVESSVEENADRQLVVVTFRTGTLEEGIQLRWEPSKLLYALDRSAYVELLTSSAGAVIPLPPEEIVASELPSELRRGPEPEPLIAQAVPTYEGPLSPLKDALAKYLQSLGLSVAADSHREVNLRESLLATAQLHMGLDWASRDNLLAAMKVALRRTLIQYGVDREQAELGAEHLVSWLKIQAAGITGSQA